MPDTERVNIYEGVFFSFEPSTRYHFARKYMNRGCNRTYPTAVAAYVGLEPIRGSIAM